MHEREKMVLSRINDAMSFQPDRRGKTLRWFYCFGTMLEYFADKTFSLNYDIDIGVMFDEYDPEAMLRSWKSFGYQCTEQLLHPKHKIPVNLHFTPTDERLDGTPTVDIFAFVEAGGKHAGKYLYSYDINKTQPKKVEVWKTVPVGLFSATEQQRNRYLKGSNPEARQLIDEDGFWYYDVFERHGPYKMRLPYAYGTLLDLWYPGWRFREYYRGQSRSEEMVNVKKKKKRKK